MGSRSSRTRWLAIAGRRAARAFIGLAAAGALLATVGTTLRVVTAAPVADALLLAGIAAVVAAPPVVALQLAAMVWRRDRPLAAYGIGAVVVAVVGALLTLGG